MYIPEINIDEIYQIDNSEITVKEKYIRLKRLLERNCKEITSSETLQFPSLFSRVIFISQKYQLSKHLEWRLHNIRISATRLQKSELKEISIDEYNKAKNTLLELYSSIEGKKSITKKEDSIQSVSLPSDKIRVQLIAIDRKNKYE